MKEISVTMAKNTAQMAEVHRGEGALLVALGRGQASAVVGADTGTDAVLRDSPG